MPTINKPFGIADPHYDALRVQSNQAIAAGSGAGGIVPGAGLLNKIYVWHGDSSPLEVFEPDATGLANALSVTRDGDTTVLPSIQIDLTAGITLPVGSTLRGLSHRGTILSFTTLSSASAITHSARSTLEHLTVIVDGTQPLIGVNARAAKACVRHVAVYMADHANNVKIYAGYPE